MSAADARRAAAIAELTRDWQMVRHHLERARSVTPASGLPESALVALSLDHAYQAFESMLVRLERVLGLPARAGSEWHGAVLADATLDLPDVRPAVVATEHHRDWADLLAFRHFLRHAYTVELDAEKLVKNVTSLGRAVDGTEPRVVALLASLG